VDQEFEGVQAVMDASYNVRAVLRGSVQPLGASKSAIGKRPVTTPVSVHALGLDGDEQADRRVHGGEDKALHCYAWDHYAAWRLEIPAYAHWDEPGAFGENLSVEGLTEERVCLGDRWRIGTAVVVVSQGRQPCFKLNLRLGVPDMAARVHNTLRAGWYLRVVQPGEVAAGNRMVLLDRPYPAFSVARVLALIRDRVTDPAQIEPVLQLPLPPSWRRLFEQRLHAGQVEDWSTRMQLPP
jgi:MOSC domain-containing protein YiiM